MFTAHFWKVYVQQNLLLSIIILLLLFVVLDIWLDWIHPFYTFAIGYLLAGPLSFYFFQYKRRFQPKNSNE